ncbi:MAG: flagellin, partial [Halarsenatibacteraceae bacterium]
NITTRAEIGAKMNRLDLTQSRLEEQEINFESLKSDNEDVDIAETIMNLRMQESVYQASLATGARIMQPTLLDFLR